jgi:SET domain
MPGKPFCELFATAILVPPIANRAATDEMRNDIDSPGSRRRRHPPLIRAFAGAELPRDLHLRISYRQVVPTNRDAFEGGQLPLHPFCFLSHPRRPNCEVVTDVKGGRERLYLRVLRKVTPGTELTIDYGEGIHESPFGEEWEYWSRPFPNWNGSKKTADEYMKHIDRLFDQ